MPSVRAVPLEDQRRLRHFTNQELPYILGPTGLYGQGLPGETFRVLKQRKVKQFGEYRIRRLVLEAWEKQSLG